MDREGDAHKLRELMQDLIEGKIRLRAHELYQERGQEEGSALEDWLKAEAEVLKSSILAPLYRRSRGNQASCVVDVKEDVVAGR